MDSVRAMQTTRNNLRSYLKQINEVDSNTLTSTILIYQWFVKKERTLYSTLNCLKPEKQILYGFLWSPLMPNEIFNVISGIRDENKGISGPQIEEISDWGDHNPPTLIRTNDFLAPF
jgi:vacuolar-type H+-ATPase subunit I/STV1